MRIWERNPFYYAVDTAGQQLPYIDRIVSQTVNGETYKLKVIAGEADYATSMALTDYPLLKQSEQDGGDTATLIEGLAGADVAYTFGVDNLDPVKRELFNNVDFSRAMSLAIDRETVNETVWLGQAVPRQATARNDVSFYKPEWGEEHPYARYDPDEANRMLDAIGLDKRNNDGVRLMANGEPLNLVLTFGAPGDGDSAGGNPQVLTHELVKEYWEAVGARIQLNPLDGDSISRGRDVRHHGHPCHRVLRLRVRQQQPDGRRPPRRGPLLLILVGREQRAQRRRPEHGRYGAAR